MFDITWTDSNVENIAQKRERKQKQKNESDSQVDGRISSHSNSSRKFSGSSRDRRQPLVSDWLGSVKSGLGSVKSAVSSVRSGVSSGATPPTPTTGNAPPTESCSRTPRESLNSLPKDNLADISPFSNQSLSFEPSVDHDSLWHFAHSHPKDIVHSPVKSRSGSSYSTAIASVTTKPSDNPSLITARQELDSMVALSSGVQWPNSPSSVFKTTEVKVSESFVEGDMERVGKKTLLGADLQGPHRNLTGLPKSTRDELYLNTTDPSDITQQSVVPSGLITPSSFLPENPDSWKATQEWERPVLAANFPRAPATAISLRHNQESGIEAFDLNSITRELKKMAVASSKLILLRISEDWGQCKDDSLFNEVEMERMRWMHAALYNLDGNLEQALNSPRRGIWPRLDRILSLYDNKGIHRNAEFHHVSTEPLSPVLYPNVVPLTTPMISCKNLPLAARLYDRAYCLQLAPLFPASDIPAVMRQIHRCLSPGGRVRFILLDPQPLASTLGPKLRAWLDDHLIINLERSFRCLNPTRLFPGWMTDALLRGEGSVMTHVKFPAVEGKLPPPGSEDACLTTTFVPPQPQSRSVFQHAERSSVPKDQTAPRVTTATANQSDGEDSETRQRLHCKVGRMLWVEMWGSFVEASRWWWEDDAIVEECEQLGTAWECRMVEGVKD